MSDTGPDDLKRLGARLDDAQQRLAPRKTQPPPTQSGIAFRFSTELVAALLVGGAIGWGLDWLFGYFGIHTKPCLMIAFVVHGIAAGIRNVMHAANEINAQMTAQGPAPAAKDDEES